MHVMFKLRHSQNFAKSFVTHVTPLKVLRCSQPFLNVALQSLKEMVGHEPTTRFLILLMLRNLPARPGFPLTLASFGKVAPPHPHVRFPRSLRSGRPLPSLSSARPTPLGPLFRSLPSFVHGSFWANCPLWFYS